MSDQGSSGDTSGSTEFKAGHAPAIKVGGMRVGASRPRQTSHGDDKDKNISSEEATEDNITAGGKGSTENTNQKSGEDDDDEQGSRAVSNRVAGQMVSGTFVPIQEAFPTEAVKHIHDKPGTHPKNDYHNRAKYDEQRFINQPRKQ